MSIKELLRKTKIRAHIRLGKSVYFIQKRELAFLIASGVFVLIALILWWMSPDSILKNIKAATVVGFFTGLGIIILSGLSACSSTKAWKLSRRSIASDIRYDTSFYQHIDAMPDTLYITPDKSESFFCACLSTLAYGMLARYRNLESSQEALHDEKSVYKFFKLINDWLEIVSQRPSDFPRAHLRLSCWNHGPHKIFAAPPPEEKENREDWLKRNEKILTMLLDLLKEIRKLNLQKQLGVEIYSTHETDYRLFVRKEGTEYRGMMVVIPPLSKGLIKTAKVQFATITTRRHEAYMPLMEFCDETMFPTSGGEGKEITQFCLYNPTKFIEVWFRFKFSELA